MKTLAILSVLALACAGASPAYAIEIVTGNAAARAHPNLAPLPVRNFPAAVQLPQLPEPEVVAMMLLGLVLIGYRASRDNNETFK